MWLVHKQIHTLRRVHAIDDIAKHKDLLTVIAAGYRQAPIRRAAALPWMSEISAIAAPMTPYLTLVDRQPVGADMAMQKQHGAALPDCTRSQTERNIGLLMINQRCGSRA